jgi:hypothetical protein
MPKYLLAIKARRFEFGRVTVSGSAQKLGAPPESSPMNVAFAARLSRRTAKLAPAENVSRPINTESPRGRSISGPARNRSRSR